MKKTIIWVIRKYQQTISPDKGFLVSLGIKKSSTCVFYPTCSDYMVEAVEKYGAWKGLWMGLRRIGRCHPWQKKHIDPV